MTDEKEQFTDQPDGKEIKARCMKNERTIVRFIIAAIIIVPVLAAFIFLGLYSFFFWFCIMYGEHC